MGFSKFQMFKEYIFFFLAVFGVELGQNLFIFVFLHFKSFYTCVEVWEQKSDFSTHDLKCKKKTQRKGAYKVWI